MEELVLGEPTEREDDPRHPVGPLREPQPPEAFVPLVGSCALQVKLAKPHGDVDVTAERRGHRNAVVALLRQLPRRLIFYYKRVGCTYD
ncbi:MAG: hypothetical protein KIH62_001905 [Candidatus Kerfeldbacteria bacterium]|nr:hypothetical protein [Candidatus Kerfeldbacteria bacterium]